MAQLLEWSNVDTNIQSEMGNQAPPSSRRLEAMNNEIRNVNTQYDITSSRRSASLSIIPNGTTYLLSTLISDDDIKKIDLIFPTDDSSERKYDWVEKNQFFFNINDGISANEYTTYFDDGSLYIAINSTGGETVSTEYTIEYFSIFLGITDAGVFIENVTDNGTDLILLPSRFKDLIMLGAVKRLLYQSLGDEGNTQLAIVSNRYKAELIKLGLDSATKPLKREVRKFKIHNPTD